MNTTPTCVGIILDGNRRYAKREGLSSLMGHKMGADKVTDCVRWVKNRHIPHLAIYAFSSENWKRSEEEVGYLMQLFSSAVDEWFSTLHKEGVRFRVVGDRESLPQELRSSIQTLEEASAEEKDITVWVCLSYGGRAEIVAAAKDLAQIGSDVTEESLRAHLWSAQMPDPDIIIRTGGEKRLSNFLLWQSAYSELFFLNTFWPEFQESDLDQVLSEYAQRERRHGK